MSIIFHYDILLVPIHNSTGIGHWSVAAVFVKEKKIRRYDSIADDDYFSLSVILVYLEAEYESKNGPNTFDFANWSLEIEEGLPKQENSYDCGVFCCKYADYIASKSAITFDQSNIPFFASL